MYTILLLLITSPACTSTLARWPLASSKQLHLSEELCQPNGIRIAIVPGPVSKSAMESAVHNFRSYPAGHQVVTFNSPTELQVNGAEFDTVSATTELLPEMVGESAANFRRLGFVVVDRTHIESILEEQDLTSVLGSEVVRIGQLLGADVLAITSVHVYPTVYFTSSRSGAWAFYKDYTLRVHENYVSVRDGAHLGSWSTSGSLLAALGFAHLEAREVTGVAATDVVYCACKPDGACIQVSDLDLRSEFDTRRKESTEQVLSDWSLTCARLLADAESRDAIGQ